SEFFAFFSVFEKFAGILGPLVFALMIRATGSSRGAILSLIAFFLVGGALLVVQFVGIPFSFLFGYIATKIGAKRAIFIGLLAYTAISILGYFMTTATHFFVLAGLVGMVQGGTQALSRSLFASMVPKHKSGEFFGFFSVFEKFAGIVGPLFFYVAIEITGSSRSAILSIIAFFAVGALLLARVDPAEGARAARAAEADLRAATA
ncbi:MAG TPA: MFS transporter, partial [Gemmatimonadales bacterium]|nr:MFS transporter [Gemmatimonadales bacterium]